MLQAKTIMIKDVVSIRPQDTLDKVIGILVDKDITGIPVINEDRTLAGIITERDILSYMLDHHRTRYTQLYARTGCDHPSDRQQYVRAHRLSRYDYRCYRL
ncbi:MAG: CBS domain-containing protein [Planctomycetota bacterium]